METGKMSRVASRSLLLAASFCHVLVSVAAAGLRPDQVYVATEQDDFRYETATQETHLTPPGREGYWDSRDADWPRMAPGWFNIPEMTAPSLTNDSWLDWPPWNISDGGWMELEYDDRSTSLYWVGCMIPVPIILLIIYVIYLQYIVKTRTPARLPRGRDSSDSSHHLRRHTSKVSRVIHAIRMPSRLMNYRSDRRGSDCEELCNAESPTTVDFYKLTNEEECASESSGGSTDLAAYNELSAVNDISDETKQLTLFKRLQDDEVGCSMDLGPNCSSGESSRHESKMPPGFVKVSHGRNNKQESGALYRQLDDEGDQMDFDPVTKSNYEIT